MMMERNRITILCIYAVLMRTAGAVHSDVHCHISIDTGMQRTEHGGEALSPGLWFGHSSSAAVETSNWVCVSFFSLDLSHKNETIKLRKHKWPLILSKIIYDENKCYHATNAVLPRFWTSESHESYQRMNTQHHDLLPYSYSSYRVMYQP